MNNLRAETSNGRLKPAHLLILMVVLAAIAGWNWRGVIVLAGEVTLLILFLVIVGGLVANRVSAVRRRLDNVSTQ